jgi:hypothetical protein
MWDRAHFLFRARPTFSHQASLEPGVRSKRPAPCRPPRTDWQRRAGPPTFRRRPSGSPPPPHGRPRNPFRRRLGALSSRPGVVVLFALDDAPRKEEQDDPRGSGLAELRECAALIPFPLTDVPHPVPWVRYTRRARSQKECPSVLRRADPGVGRGGMLRAGDSREDGRGARAPRTVLPAPTTHRRRRPACRRRRKVTPWGSRRSTRS